MKTKQTVAIGLDIGGTKMQAVLFDGQTVLAVNKLATPRHDLTNFLIMLKALIEPLLETIESKKLDLLGLGIGCAGTISHDQQTIITSPNLTILNNINLVELIKNKLNLNTTIKLDNDAHCFVRAESLLGIAKNYNHIYGLTIGTGIGGAAWINNQVLQNQNTTTSEPGHIIINFEKKATLESIYHDLTQNNPKILAQECETGDILAIKMFEEFGRYLGISLANIINLTNPEVIVLGGSVIKAEAYFLETTKQYMQENIFSEDNKNIEILISSLGGNAAAIGAAKLII